MGSPAKSLSALLIGLGIGAVGGAYLGVIAIWVGLIAAVVGVGLSFVSSQPATVSGEAKVQPPSEGPQLSELGPRVEQILRLAEEQAEDYRTQAKREAERTLLEARVIVDKTRAEAAGPTPLAAKPEVDRSSSEK